MFGSRHKPSILKRAVYLIWPRRGPKRALQYLMRRLARLSVSPHRLALGFAAGAFASFTPFIGLHFVIAGLVAFILRGNLFASALGTVVGNPLTFPMIWMLSYNLGMWLMGNTGEADLTSAITVTSSDFLSDGPIAFITTLWQNMGPYVVPTLLGGIPLGIMCGAISYFLVFAAIKHVKSHKKISVQV